MTSAKSGSAQQPRTARDSRACGSSRDEGAWTAKFAPRADFREVLIRPRGVLDSFQDGKISALPDGATCRSARCGSRCSSRPNRRAARGECPGGARPSGPLIALVCPCARIRPPARGGLPGVDGAAMYSHEEAGFSDSSAAQSSGSRFRQQKGLPATRAGDGTAGGSGVVEVASEA